MIKFIIAAAVFITSTAADGHNLRSPKVGNIMPKNGWEIYDFVEGFMLGAYIPLMLRANNYDCQSYLFSWGVNISGQSGYFD